MQVDLANVWRKDVGDDFSAEAMQKHVVHVEQFRNRIADAVVAFSDQVPWWGLICRKKQMYLHHEYEGRRKQTAGWCSP